MTAGRGLHTRFKASAARFTPFPQGTASLWSWFVAPTPATEVVATPRRFAYVGGTP